MIIKNKSLIKTILHAFLLVLFIAQNIYATDKYIPLPRNKVKTIIPLSATTDASQLNTTNSLIQEQYSDGLGRPTVVVKKAATPAKNDLITIQNYDRNNQVLNQWQPVPVASANIPNPNAAVQQANTFYNDTVPYSTITRSPDEITICAPGASWHKGNKVKVQDLSTAMGPGDSQYNIRQYGVNGDALVLYDDWFEIYSANMVQTTDEDGHISITCTDAWGRTLLQRKVNNGVNYDTYYVYDDLGHLRFVLSPEASDRLSSPGSYTLGSSINGDNDPLAQYTYIYKYNDKGQCSAKKLPGRDWVYMVYDQTGRLILTQDGNQHPANKWTFYKYDVLGRVIQSGKTVLTDSQSTLQAKYNGITLSESYQTGSGYSNLNPLSSKDTILTQNFYDTYDFINLPTYTSLKSNLTYTTVSGFDSKDSVIVNGTDLITQGLLTGTTVAMLDNSATIVTAMYYNDKGQVVQSRSNNHLSGYDYNFFRYSFAGLPLNKRHVHKTPYITAELIENYRFQYDNASRLVSIRHALNTQKEVLMDSLVYDDLGRVSKKILHGGVQNINYTYNIHNQVKSQSSEKFAEMLYYQDSPYGGSCYNGNISANSFGTGNDKLYIYSYDQLDRLLNASNSSDQYFNESVGSYDKNGNIQSLVRTGYVYDQGRNITQGVIDNMTLTHSGNHLKKVSDAADQSVVITTNDFVDKQDANYPTEYLYDANGNLYADLNKGIARITYNLLNMPQKVQFRNGTKNEYLYDAMGTKHRASYNYSQSSNMLPLGDTGAGNTLGASYQMDYCGNYVYEKSGSLSTRLKYILTPEGYIQTYAGMISYIGYWSYVYALKDHQGNTRVNLSCDYIKNTSKTYSASDQIDYYPFGLERSNTGQTSGGCFNSGTNPYLYSGNEIDRLNGLNQYDFKARWLDNAVPGFTTMDPLAERHYSESPYSYCGVNPVNRVDPTGLDYFKGPGGAIKWQNSNDKNISLGDGEYENIGDTYTQDISEIDGSIEYGTGGSRDETYIPDETTSSSSFGFADAMSMLWQNEDANYNNTTEGIDAGGGAKGGNSENNGPSLEHIATAVSTGADVVGTPIGIAKTVLKESGEALKGFTRTGTVLGAIAGGGPALYNIASNRGTWKDWASLGLAGLGVLTEFTGIGEAWDTVAVPVAVGTAVVSVSLDVYNIIDENKK